MLRVAVSFRFNPIYDHEINFQYHRRNQTFVTDRKIEIGRTIEHDRGLHEKYNAVDVRETV